MLTLCLAANVCNFVRFACSSAVQSSIHFGLTPLGITEKGSSETQELPVFLRGNAASHFYAIPVATYKDAVAELKKSLCPAAHCENFCSKFENRPPRSCGDPAVYKWELENLVAKADPELSNDAKTALIQRQFMKGLPDTIKHKLLEHNPTPNIEEMLSLLNDIVRSRVTLRRGFSVTWPLLTQQLQWRTTTPSFRHWLPWSLE